MRENQSPSADMLHSVGALMDTAFLRRAVADATEPPRGPIAPGVLAHSRPYDWLRRVLVRRRGRER